MRALAALRGRTKEHENINHARSAKHDTLHAVDTFFFSCLTCVSVCECILLCRTCLRAFTKATQNQIPSAAGRDIGVRFASSLVWNARRIKARCVFSHRAPATSVCLLTSSLSTRPRISSAQVIHLHKHNLTHLPRRPANLSPPPPPDVAHYYLFCSPNLPNPFQQVLTSAICSLTHTHTRVDSESHTGKCIAIFKLKFFLAGCQAARS